MVIRVNFMVVLTTILLSSGCSTFDRKINTDVVTVKVPVVFSPAPPVVIRPDLVIHDMTEKQRNDAGSLAKYYKATIVQLLGYTSELEAALEQYQAIHEALKASNDAIEDGVDTNSKK